MSNNLNLKTMEGTIILKRTVKSAKFNLTFPANVEHKAFKDVDNNIYAFHKVYSNVLIRINEKNIKELVLI